MNTSNLSPKEMHDTLDKVVALVSKRAHEAIDNQIIGPDPFAHLAAVSEALGLAFRARHADCGEECKHDDKKPNLAIVTNLDLKD